MTDRLRFPLPRIHPFEPPPDYARLRASEPVSKVTMWDGSEAWLVTRYDDVRLVLADPRFSADISRPGFPQVNAGRAASVRQERSFISMDRPEHDHFRRRLAPDFSVRRAEARRSQIAAIASRQLDVLIDAPQPADLVSLFALPVPSMVICHLLGVPYEDHNFFQNRASVRASLQSTPEAATAANQDLLDYLGRLVAAKKRRPADDLISRLAAENAGDGALTHNHAVGTAHLLLTAGHETVANMIALGVAVLDRHPDQLLELRQDPRLVPNAVDELLRYLSVVQFSARRVAVDDAEIGGTVIHAGEGVIAPVYSANFDDAAFPDAHRFDIHRQARHHLAFGHATHLCLGHALARVELQVVFEMLLQRAPAIRVAPPEHQIRFKRDMPIYGVQELPVELSGRQLRADSRSRVP